MKKCPECEASLDDEGVNFCPECGVDLSSNKTNINYCSNCGGELDEEVKYCSNCGEPVSPQQQKARSSQSGGSNSFHREANTVSEDNKVSPSGVSKSPGLAAFLSVVVVGLGQMYLGQVGKGVAMLFGAIFLGMISMGTLAIPIWIAAAIDAYQIGQKLQRGQSVGKWEWF